MEKFGSRSQIREVSGLGSKGRVMCAARRGHLGWYSWLWGENVCQGDIMSRRVQSQRAACFNESGGSFAGQRKQALNVGWLPGTNRDLLQY